MVKHRPRIQYHAGHWHVTASVYVTKEQWLAAVRWARSMNRTNNQVPNENH